MYFDYAILRILSFAPEADIEPGPPKENPNVKV